MSALIDNPQNPAVRCVASSKFPPCDKSGSRGLNFLTL